MNISEVVINCNSTAVCLAIDPGVGIATIIYSNPELIAGTVANHICRIGFVPNFDLVRTCTGDANTADWDLPEETCRRTFMPALRL